MALIVSLLCHTGKYFELARLPIRFLHGQMRGAALAAEATQFIDLPVRRIGVHTAAENRLGAHGWGFGCLAGKRKVVSAKNLAVWTCSKVFPQKQAIRQKALKDDHSGPEAICA
jgi:hypothetical protein